MPASPFTEDLVLKKVNRTPVSGYVMYKLKGYCVFDCASCGKKKTLKKVTRNESTGEMRCRCCYQELLLEKSKVTVKDDDKKLPKLPKVKVEEPEEVSDTPMDIEAAQKNLATVQASYHDASNALKAAQRALKEAQEILPEVQKTASVAAGKVSAAQRVLNRAKKAAEAPEEQEEGADVVMNDNTSESGDKCKKPKRANTVFV